MSTRPLPRKRVNVKALGKLHTYSNVLVLQKDRVGGGKGVGVQNHTTEQKLRYSLYNTHFTFPCRKLRTIIFIFPTLFDTKTCEKRARKSIEASSLLSKYKVFLRGVFLDFFIYVLYSTLLYLPPLRFYCVGGCLVN